MKIVNENEFENEVKEGYTLVDFFANWCGPCKMLGPVLEELSEERKDVKFIKVDCDESDGLAMKFGVMTIPALFLLKNGEVVAKTGGYQPKNGIEKFINDNMK